MNRELCPSLRYLAKEKNIRLGDYLRDPVSNSPMLGIDSNEVVLLLLLVLWSANPVTELLVPDV